MNRIMSALNQVKRHLKPGQVYRRADVARWSNAVDRHLKELVEEGTLNKVSPGVYSYPKTASFGRVPPEDKKLVKAFLKSDDFLLLSPNAYNALGVGTSQLYNEQIVYNRKRHGKFRLAGRVYDFRMKPYFPKTLTKEFLLVDLVNNVNHLAEHQESVLEKVRDVSVSLDPKKLLKAAEVYGSVRAKKLFRHELDVENRNAGA
jgi:hypothetical protein